MPGDDSQLRSPGRRSLMLGVAALAVSATLILCGIVTHNEWLILIGSASSGLPGMILIVQLHRQVGQRRT